MKTKSKFIKNIAHLVQLILFFVQKNSAIIFFLRSSYVLVVHEYIKNLGKKIEMTSQLQI